MSGKVIVNIISEQTIPNVLFIREFKSRWSIEKYIFVITPSMKSEDKLNKIVTVGGISENNIVEIEVPYDDFPRIKQELSKNIADSQAEYIVNLTGGTKIMMLAVYEFFKTFKSTFYYLPINKDYFEEISSGKKHKITTFLTCAEYLKAYGYLMKAREAPGDPLKTYQSFLKHYIKNLERGDKDKKTSNIIFKGGKWLEDYIYLFLKDILKGKPHDLYVGVDVYGGSILSEKTKNEFDIVLTYKNRLYVGECKSSIRKKIKKISISEELYKLGALVKRLGLGAKGILITLNPKAVVRIPGGYAVKQEFNDRARLLNLEIITLAELADATKLRRRLESILQIEREDRFKNIQKQF